VYALKHVLAPVSAELAQVLRGRSLIRLACIVQGVGFQVCLGVWVSIMRFGFRVSSKGLGPRV